jgi:hypothetical protein
MILSWSTVIKRSFGGTPRYAGLLTREPPNVKGTTGDSVSIEMDGKHKSKYAWVRMLAFALAVLFVVFSAQALGHSHEKGQNEARCQVCQAAHIGSAPASVAQWLVTPLASSGYVEPFVVAFHQELFFHDAPSRAPPTA